MSPQIFISYAHKNSEFVNQLAKDIEKQGYDIWLDRTDIQTGSHWDDEIVTGLKTSKVFMVILSEAATASQNVKDEIGYAIDHDMQIMPLLIEPCEIPFRLRRIQYVDFTSSKYGDGIKSVLEILRTFLSDGKADPNRARKVIDPAAMATTVTGVLAPFLAKTAQAGKDKAGEKLPEKVGNLWSAIFKHFERNPTASGIAGDLAKDSRDTDNQEAFAIQLKKALKEDGNFAILLADLLDDAQTSIKKDGDNVIATHGGIAVNKIQVGGNLHGNITIGNNNKIEGDN